MASPTSTAAISSASWTAPRTDGDERRAFTWSATRIRTRWRLLRDRAALRHRLRGHRRSPPKRRKASLAGRRRTTSSWTTSTPAERAQGAREDRARQRRAEFSVTTAPSAHRASQAPAPSPTRAICRSPKGCWSACSSPTPRASTIASSISRGRSRASTSSPRPRTSSRRWPIRRRPRTHRRRSPRRRSRSAACARLAERVHSVRRGDGAAEATRSSFRFPHASTRVYKR